MHTQQAEADGATPPAGEPCTGNQQSKNRPRSSALPSTDTRVQEAVHRYSGRASRWPSASRKPTPSRHLRPAIMPERPIIESKNSRSVIPTENPERYINRRSVVNVDQYTRKENSTYTDLRYIELDGMLYWHPVEWLNRTYRSCSRH